MILSELLWQINSTTGSSLWTYFFILFQLHFTTRESLFNNILNEFQEKLEKDFSKMLTQASVVELKQDLVASWLADCSMEFRSV